MTDHGAYLAVSCTVSRVWACCHVVNSWRNGKCCIDSVICAYWFIFHNRSSETYLEWNKIRLIFLDRLYVWYEIKICERDLSCVFVLNVATNVQCIHYRAVILFLEGSPNIWQFIRIWKRDRGVGGGSPDWGFCLTGNVSESGGLQTGGSLNVVVVRLRPSTCGVMWLVDHQPPGPWGSGTSWYPGSWHYVTINLLGRWIVRAPISWFYAIMGPSTSGILRFWDHQPPASWDSGTTNLRHHEILGPSTSGIMRFLDHQPPGSCDFWASWCPGWWDYRAINLWGFKSVGPTTFGIARLWDHPHVGS